MGEIFRKLFIAVLSLFFSALACAGIYWLYLIAKSAATGE